MSFEKQAQMIRYFSISQESFLLTILQRYDRHVTKARYNPQHFCFDFVLCEIGFAEGTCIKNRRFFDGIAQVCIF